MRFILLGLGALALASCTIYEYGPDYRFGPNECSGQVGLASNGSFCDTDSQCCSGSCGDEGTCCVQPGASCFDSSTCCIGRCSNAGACSCNAVGRSCSRYSDCCSGDCNNGRCIASNGTCATTADCSAGTCERFRCTVAGDLGASVTDGPQSLDLETQD